MCSVQLVDGLGYVQIAGCIAYWTNVDCIVERQNASRLNKGLVLNNVHQKVDLLIIGGGVLGAFHAYHAIQRGLRVVLLERNAAPQGATVRNFGQVVPSGMDRHWQQYGRDSLQIYQELQRQHDLSVRQLGSIYIASNEEELCLIEELHAIDKANDYESEIVSSAWCCARYPLLREDYCKGGLYYPQEISVNPRQMIHQLHKALGEQAAYQAHFESQVCSLVADERGAVAETSLGETFVADKAIVCSGAEFRLLFPELFRVSDLVAVKLQMMRLRPQPTTSLPGNILTGLSIRRYESFAQCPSWSEVKEREASDSFWKKWGVHILFKQEADGGIILGDSHEYAAAENVDSLGFDLRREISDYFIQEAKQIFNLPSWDVEAEWAGIYSQTNDPSGIFTKTIGQNIHIVTGIGGKGMTSSAGYSKQHLKEIYND